MNALKILNIALFAFLITLVLQVFLPNNKQNQPTEGLSMIVTTKNVTIPNIPKISIQNNTQSGVTYNPCTDIILSINSISVDNIASVYGDKCGNINIEPKTSKELDLSPLYKNFASTKFVGQHILTIKNSDFGENGKAITYQVEKPGFFRSLLSMIAYEPVYNLFVAILTILPGHQLGWAIVIITIIIRLILLVPQNKMLENSKRMAKINPKIKALQEQYKDDRATLGMKMMELYKEEKISPMGSCLPMLIQFPILIALYWVISGISDVSNFYHLYSFFSGFNPNSINTLFFGQNLLDIGGKVGLVMAVVLGITQFIQLKLSFTNQPKNTDKKPKKQENENQMPAFDPEAMQKIMLFVFPIMIGVTGYLFPLGLGLYWFIGLIFMIFQQIYVNKKSDKNNVVIVKNKKSH